MLYRLKTGNFSNVNAYAVNKLFPRSYFIPFSDREKAKTVALEEERYSSDAVRCLSGEWDFLFIENPTDLADPFDTDAVMFDRVQVPSCWQFTGYAKPFYLNARYPFKADPPRIPTVKAEPYHLGVKLINPVDAYNNIGVYRRFIDIPDDDKTRKLAFLGVCSCVDVFINGRFVGYSEGSHNTAEFNVDEFLTPGKNELVCVVRRWCNGTYLECQDMFRNNGIFRDVLLYETPKENIYDYEIVTEKTEKGYNLTVKVTVENPNGGTVSVELDCEGKTYTQSSTSSETTSFFFADLPVREWSAESPVLYPLLFGLNGQYFRTEIGFKTIFIRDAVYYFNDKPIKLLGVNHHDTSPTAGYVMTVKELEKDVRLMKQFNVNCVRTSHYPPDPVFLRFCDRYGLYVVDEADIETHGMDNNPWGINGISNNLFYKDLYWDRVQRMYFRDRNHPSICMWSLGNESGGFKCQDYCYHNIKKHTSIPIHYEGVIRTRRKAYDIRSEMYTPISFMRRRHRRALALRNRCYKPYFLCEYAHAMGVGPGSLNDYYNLFMLSNHYLGGCIWEWADHAVLHKDGSYTYGGDHGEYVHDGNFCVDGLFYPDRRPSRSAFEMKNVYRPIRAKFSGKELHLTNTRFFTDSSDILIKVLVRADEKIVSETTKTIIIEPQKSFSYTPVLPVSDNIDIVIYYIDKETREEIAFENIIVKEDLDKSPATKRKLKELLTVSKKSYDVEVTGDDIEITDKDKTFRYVFNKKSCTFTVIETGGVNLVNSSPTNRHGVVGSYTEMFRAPFDNDRYPQIMWKTQGMDSYSIKPKFVRVEKKFNAFVIYASFRFKSNRILATETDRISVFPNGTILYDVFFTPWFLPFLARIGKTFEWNKDLTRSTWFGRGPGESYPDFKAGTKLGSYSTDISEEEPYIYPQHNGTMGGVRHASVTDEDGGKGITFKAYKHPFYWTAKHYTERELDKWTHREEMSDLPATFTTVDGFFRGVGSASCGPLPLFIYTLSGVPFRQYHYRFSLNPFNDEEPADALDPEQERELQEFLSEEEKE